VTPCPPPSPSSHLAQTRYVLSKALAKGLRPILVVNKCDRWVPWGGGEEDVLWVVVIGATWVLAHVRWEGAAAGRKTCRGIAGKAAFVRSMERR
jgi:hypothetical protein